MNEASKSSVFFFKMATAVGGQNRFEDDLENCVNVSLAKFFPEIKTTTKQQMEAWRGLFRGNDVFAILPTGVGKLLIYHPMVAHRYQNNSKLSFNFILHSNLINNQVQLEIKFISTQNQILFQSCSNSTIFLTLFTSKLMLASTLCLF